jgi:methylmalonyl-CoA mutase
MTAPADDLPLAAEFPAASRDAWRRLVEGVLKGAAFDTRLVAKTYDDLAIEPLYGRKTAQPVAGRAPGTAWWIMQRVDHPDAAAANAEALHDLENGATGLALVFAGGIGAYGYGLAADGGTLPRVLAGIHLDAGIALDLDAGTCHPGKELAALVQRSGVAAAATNIRFGYDPIGTAAASGASPLPWNEQAPAFAAALRELTAQGFRGPFACADGRLIHNAGGSEAQELAYALAVAVQYLRALEAGGIALDAARAMIYFRLAADADQFLTMAKFRALRTLWARVEDTCGLAPEPPFVGAETAWRMMTRRDPYVNMLRATIAVVGAGLGADAITVLPFTLALGLPDRFARRIARNTQLVLLEESNLAKVADPAAGAGGIEDLTDKLCRAAWAAFQEIEAAGGAWAALQQGLIQSKVAAVRGAREAAVARRKDALTGTSDFPDLAEAPVAVLEVAPVAPPPMAAAPTFEPLPRIRLAEPFEALRDASDRTLAQTGARPKVFLANLGTPADFTARATFAKNFFEAGGIEAVGNDGFESRDALVAAFRASGARLTCLCSSDAVYAREAVATAQTLRDAGAVLLLAGRPGALEAALTEAGVRGFVFAGCDALAALRTTHGLIAS